MLLTRERCAIEMANEYASSDFTRDGIRLVCEWYKTRIKIIKRIYGERRWGLS